MRVPVRIASVAEDGSLEARVGPGRKEWNAMAEMQIQVRIGDMTVAVKSDNQCELIELAAFFSELPKVCPKCQAPVAFTSRKPQGYDYYGMRCTGSPTHETTFGKNKEGGTLFYKSSEPWATFVPGARTDAGDYADQGGRPAARQGSEGRSSARPRPVAAGGR